MGSCHLSVKSNVANGTTPEFISQVDSFLPSLSQCSQLEYLCLEFQGRGSEGGMGTLCMFIFNLRVNLKFQNKKFRKNAQGEHTRSNGDLSCEGEASLCPLVYTVCIPLLLREAQVAFSETSSFLLEIPVASLAVVYSTLQMSLHIWVSTGSQGQECFSPTSGKSELSADHNTRGDVECLLPDVE